MRTTIIIFLRILHFFFSSIEILLALPTIAVRAIFTARLVYAIRILIIRKKGKIKLFRVIQRSKALKRLEEKKTKEKRRKEKAREAMHDLILGFTHLYIKKNG